MIARPWLCRLGLHSWVEGPWDVIQRLLWRRCRRCGRIETNCGCAGCGFWREYVEPPKPAAKVEAGP